MEIHLLGDAVESRVPAGPALLLGQTQEAETARASQGGSGLGRHVICHTSYCLLCGSTRVCKDCSYLERQRGTFPALQTSDYSDINEKETTHAEDQTAATASECIL